jgi:hypothetical protein
MAESPSAIAPLDLGHEQWYCMGVAVEAGLESE